MKDQDLRRALNNRELLDQDFRGEAFVPCGWAGLPQEFMLLRKRHQELMHLVASLAKELGYELESPAPGHRWVKARDKYELRSRGPKCNIKT